MRAGNQLWGWWRAVVVGVGGCGCGGLEVAVGVAEGLRWGVRGVAVGWWV